MLKNYCNIKLQCLLPLILGYSVVYNILLLIELIPLNCGISFFFFTAVTQFINANYFTDMERINPALLDLFLINTTFI